MWRTRAERAYVASVTAFARDGRFDPSGQARHFARLADAGVSAIIGSSGVGEGYTLDDEERRQLFEVAQRVMGSTGGFVLMGMEARTAEQMIRLCKLAEPYKPAAVHVYGLEMGHGARATAAEAERFLRDILGAVEIPCVLCNQPQMNGFELPIALLERLVRDHDHIVGVQDISGDLRYLAAVTAEFGTELELLTTLPQAIGLLGLGGQGFSCSEGNIVPELCASVVQLFIGGDAAASRTAYQKLLGVNRAVSDVASSTGPATKAALRDLGLPGGSGLRAPRLWPSEDDRAQLLAALHSLQIAELQRLTPA